MYSDSANAKRKYKDQRFGFGGKKSGKKWNTKESHNDVSGFRAKIAHGRGAKGGKKGKGGNQNVSHFHKLCVWLFNELCFFKASQHCNGCGSQHYFSSLTETSREVRTQEDEDALVNVDTGGA